MPGIAPSRRWRRSSAISVLERWRWAAGSSDRRMSPLAVPLPREPEVTTLTTEDTVSGTAA